MLPQVLSGLQGMWCDSFGCTYLVQNDCCHVTLRAAHYTVVPLAHDGRAVWWLQRWYVDEEAVALARRGELRWKPKQPQDQPLQWSAASFWSRKQVAQVVLPLNGPSRASLITSKPEGLEIQRRCQILSALMGSSS